MRASFDKIFAAILKSEGGFVNDPRDGGGATNRGVTQAVYDDWRIKNGLAKQTVKNIAMIEVVAIFKAGYWNPCRADDLPAGVDYAVVDFAYNSGVVRANRYLQQAVGVQVDGLPGPMTLKAVKAADARELIDRICDDRLAFMKRLSNFDRFGRGWTRRVSEVRADAKAMVA